MLSYMQRLVTQWSSFALRKALVFKILFSRAYWIFYRVIVQYVKVFKEQSKCEVWINNELIHVQTSHILCISKCRETETYR